MSIWLTVTSLLEYGTMVLLLMLSIWSLTIMVDRRRTFATLSDPSLQNQIRDLINAEKWTELGSLLKASGALSSDLPHDLPHDLASGSMQTALSAPKSRVSVEHAVRSYLTGQRLRLEKGLPVLATLGSNAPFIGLFGTVLGIIQAFAVLGSQQGDAASVMGGISRALFATAAGLFVAIPAVVAFNYFSNAIRQAMNECETLKDLYLSLGYPTKNKEVSDGQWLLKTVPLITV